MAHIKYTEKAMQIIKSKFVSAEFKSTLSKLSFINEAGKFGQHIIEVDTTKVIVPNTEVFQKLISNHKTNIV